jgi:hypothetical protein
MYDEHGRTRAREGAAGTSAAECILAGLQNAFRMLVPPEMATCREFLLNPSALVDVNILKDRHRLASATTLRVRRFEDGEHLDVSFLLVPTVNLGEPAHQVGLVVTDRRRVELGGAARKCVQTFAVGRYIRSEESGELLFVSNELEKGRLGRDQLTVVWCATVRRERHGDAPEERDRRVAAADVVVLACVAGRVALLGLVAREGVSRRSAPTRYGGRAHSSAGRSTPGGTLPNSTICANVTRLVLQGALSAGPSCRERGIC